MLKVLMKSCQFLFVLVAVAIPLGIHFGKRHPITKGMVPVLTEMEWKFDHDKVPDLTGKIAVVTGANVGLGLSTVKILARNGAHVVMACRSMFKCQEAADEVRELDEADVEVMVVDLSSLQSVVSFAEELNRKHKKLHNLILNAGIMHVPYQLTDDGLESQFAVNHLSHFLLTHLLAPALIRAQPSTVVSVSSNGHFVSYPEGVKLDLKSLNDEEQYNALLAYGQSKLCNVLFAQELSNRFDAMGVQVLSNSLNPGSVNTELIRQYNPVLQKVAKSLMSSFPNVFAFTPDTAALTQVYAAVSSDILDNRLTGNYFVPIAEVCDTSENAKNITLQKGLWEFSKKLVKDKVGIDVTLNLN